MLSHHPLPKPSQPLSPVAFIHSPHSFCSRSRLLSALCLLVLIVVLWSQPTPASSLRFVSSHSQQRPFSPLPVSPSSPLSSSPSRLFQLRNERDEEQELHRDKDDEEVVGLRGQKEEEIHQAGHDDRADVAVGGGVVVGDVTGGGGGGGDDGEVLEGEGGFWLFELLVICALIPSVIGLQRRKQYVMQLHHRRLDRMVNS